MVIKLDKVPGKTVGVLGIHGIASVFLILLIVVSGFSTVGHYSAFADIGGGGVGASDPALASGSTLGSAGLSVVSAASSGSAVGSVGVLPAGDYVYMGRLVTGTDHVRQYNLSMFNRASGAFVKDIPVVGIGADRPGYARALYAVSPDGARIYAVCPGHVLEVDANTGECINHTGVVHYPCDLAVSPDGRTIYVADYNPDGGGSDGQYSLLLVDSGTFNLLSQVNKSVCSGFSFDLSGSHYLAAGRERVYIADSTGSYPSIREFDVADPSNPRLNRSWPAPSEFFCSGMLVLSPDGNTLVEGVRVTDLYWSTRIHCGWAYFQVRDLAAGDIVKAVELDLAPLLNSTPVQPSMAFSPAGDRLYVGVVTPWIPVDATPGVILEYDTNDYRLAHTYKDVCLRPCLFGGAIALAVSPDGNTLFYTDTASPEVDGTLIALDRTTGEKTSVLVNGAITQILPNPVNDPTGFRVVDSVPHDGEVYAGSNIAVSFSQPVNTATVNGSTFNVTDSLGQPVTGEFTYSAGNTTVTFTPASMANTYYACKLTPEIQSVARTPLENDYLFAFYTQRPDYGYLAFVINSLDKSISVVNPKCMLELKRIQFDYQPVSYDVSGDGSTLYVADDNGSFYKLDVLTGNLMRVPVGCDLTFVKCNPASSLVYIGGEVGNITIIDPSMVDGTLVDISRCKVGEISNVEWPVDAAFSKDGSYGYVARMCGPDSPDNIVSAVDLTTGNIVWNVTVGDIPYRVSFDPFDPDETYLYVVNLGSHNVSVIDVRNRDLRASIDVGMWPGSLAFDDDYTLHVSDPVTGHIYIIGLDPNSNDCFTITGEVPIPGKPSDVAYCPDGSYALVPLLDGNCIGDYDGVMVYHGSIPTGRSPTTIRFTPSLSMIPRKEPIVNTYQEDPTLDNQLFTDVVQIGNNTVLSGTGIGYHPYGVWEPSRNAWRFNFNITGLTSVRFGPSTPCTILNQSVQVSSTYGLIPPSTLSGMGTWPNDTGIKADYSNAYTPIKVMVNGMEHKYSNYSYFFVSSNVLPDVLVNSLNSSGVSENQLYYEWNYTGKGCPESDAIYYLNFDACVGTVATEISINSVSDGLDYSNIGNQIAITIQGIGDPETMSIDQKKAMGILKENGEWTVTNPTIYIDGRMGTYTVKTSQVITNNPHKIINVGAEEPRTNTTHWDFPIQDGSDTKLDRTVRAETYIVTQLNDSGFVDGKYYYPFNSSAYTTAYWTDSGIIERTVDRNYLTIDYGSNKDHQHIDIDNTIVNSTGIYPKPNNGKSGSSAVYGEIRNFINKCISSLGPEAKNAISGINLVEKFIALCNEYEPLTNGERLKWHYHNPVRLYMFESSEQYSYGYAHWTDSVEPGWTVTCTVKAESENTHYVAYRLGDGRIASTHVMEWITAQTPYTINAPSKAPSEMSIAELKGYGIKKFTKPDFIEYAKNNPVSEEIYNKLLSCHDKFVYYIPAESARKMVARAEV